MGQTEELTALAQECIGLRYDSAKARTILDRGDAEIENGWDNHWPVVDGCGICTGEVREQEDMDGFAMSGDYVAIVAWDDLAPAQRLTVADGRIDEL